MITFAYDSDSDLIFRRTLLAYDEGSELDLYFQTNIIYRSS